MFEWKIFEVLVSILCALTFLICSITLILICIRIRPLLSNVSILLTCNTYITLIGSSAVTFIITIFGFYYRGLSAPLINVFNCQLRTYINYIFICAFYYSCALQAMFRLFRIVFAGNRVLQSGFTLLIAILVQWIIPIFYMLAYFLLGDFEYHVEIGGCWVSFKNIRALSIGMAFIYGTPLIIMGCVYLFIVQSVRRTVQTVQIRQTANKRDILVVKRIIILVLIGMGIGIPTAFLLIIFMITNYLTSYAYHIQSLSLTTGLVFESIALILVTPQVRNILRKNRLTYPLRSSKRNLQPVH